MLVKAFALLTGCAEDIKLRNPAIGQTAICKGGYRTTGLGGLVDQTAKELQLRAWMISSVRGTSELGTRRSWIAVTFAAVVGIVPGIASAQGWYFLMPPIRHVTAPESIDAHRRLENIPKSLSGPPLDSWRESILFDLLDLKQPLHAWDQIAAFDSASECEQLRTTALAKQPQGTLKRVHAERSICISAADPRLGAKPSR